MDGLNKRIQKLRFDAGMSQRQFGRKLGVTARTIYRWETGERCPSIRYLKAILDEFQVEDVYEFTYGKREPRKYSMVEIPKLTYL